MYLQSGRVHEIRINVHKLALSSSIRARYLLSPVSFLIFLARRVSNTPDRVSCIKNERIK